MTDPRGHEDVAPAGTDVPVPAGGFLAAAKAVGLALFLLLAFFLLRYSGAGAYFSKAGLHALVYRCGLFAPLAHIAVYAVGTTFLLPATLFTLVGALVFGKTLGTIYNLLGATAGAALSFLVARHLGRDYVARLLSGRVRALDAKAERHGFILISYLRLAYFPFVPLNYAAGLTRIRFRDFLGGSALGMFPGILIFTCFLDEMSSFGSPADLLTRRFLIPLGLFVASLLLPVLVKRLAPALNSTTPPPGP